MSFFVETGEYMAAPKLKYGIGNSSSTTLSSSVSDSDTSFPLTSDTNFAAKSGEGMVLMDEGEATEENAYATGKTGSSLTIPLANRGLEGGSAQAHSSGASVKGIISVGMWNDLIDSLLNVFDQAAGTIKASLSFTTPTLITPVVKTAVSLGALGSTETIDWSAGDLQQGTLDENVTLDFSNAVAGQRLTLFLLQDGSGTNTISFTPTIIWQDDTTPTWTTTADKMNVMVIYYDGSTYYGMGAKFE